MAGETDRKTAVRGGIDKSHKEALEWIAYERSTPKHDCSISMLVREAIDTYLRLYPDMPEKAREQLPDDFEEQNPKFTPEGDINVDAILNAELGEEGAEA